MNSSWLIRGGLRKLVSFGIHTLLVRNVIPALRFTTAITRFVGANCCATQHTNGSASLCTAAIPAADCSGNRTDGGAGSDAFCFAFRRCLAGRDTDGLLGKLPAIPVFGSKQVKWFSRCRHYRDTGAVGQGGGATRKKPKGNCRKNGMPHGCFSAALSGAVAPERTSTPPDNSAHRDNSHSPSRSNTRTGRAAEPAPEHSLAVLLPEEAR